MALLPSGFGPEEGGYTIERSLRFRKSANCYLTRTPSVSGNLRTFTFSCWIKQGSAMGSGSGGLRIFESHGAGKDDFIRWNNDNIMMWFTSFAMEVKTTAVYVDPAAWYHLVWRVDTTQATASNRNRLYVNGVQVTSFQTATYPSQNYEVGALNVAGQVQHIGTYNGSSESIDGYLTEVHFIDGASYDASEFGEFDADTGAWKAKKYEGAFGYGTNGFYLNFSDNTSTTTLCADQSGNGNNWTPSNISLTAGVTYDSMTDVPTLTSEDAGNFCTLNPLYLTSYVTSSVSYTNGNLKASSSANNTGAVGSMPVSSGKWYFEAYKTNDEMIGWHPSTISLTGYPGQYAGVSIHKSGNVFYAYQLDTPYGSAATAATIGCAVDFDNQKFYWSINGTWQNSANPASNTGGFSFPSDCQNVPLIPAFRVRGSTSSEYVDANFGQRPFAYTPPTGYKALNTYNLPTPTIKDGSDHFNTVLWTGDGTSSRSITGIGFQPDFSWLKSRSEARNHTLFDAVRTAGSNKALSSSTTDPEGLGSTAGASASFGYVSAFNTDGFSVAAGTTNAAYVNITNETYVAWNWKANGSSSSNTDGSITSTVSANTSSGFSIVSYHGNSTSGATIGHGLGVAPSMFVVKSRDQARGWNVYHTSLGNTKYIQLQSTAAPVTNSAWWNNTSPSSSVITVGNDNDVNGSTQDYICYAFAPIEGFSAFGSYTGNGSVGNGPFIYTGFRPAYILLKNISAGSSSWIINDVARNDYNYGSLGTFKVLAANSSASEDVNASGINIVSNGWKMTQPGTSINNNGNVYIYAAFAENPFKYALAR